MDQKAQDWLSQRALFGGLFDDSKQKAIDELNQNKALYSNQQTPEFNPYSPQGYHTVGTYNPTLATGQQISTDPATRNKQLDSMNKLAGLSNTGLSDVDQAGYQKAMDQGNQMAKAQSDAILQNAQARGEGGSGLSYAMREMAGQGGAQRAQEGGLNQAANSAQQRALYNNMYGQQLGNLRGQDFGENAANTDIVNKFNMYNTGNQNQSQLWNLGNAQNINNMNVQNQNQAQQYNNQLKQETYADQMARNAGLAGANTGMAHAWAANDAANTAGRNQDFSNLMSIGGAIGGMPGAGGGGKASNAADRMPSESWDYQQGKNGTGYSL